MVNAAVGVLRVEVEGPSLTHPRDISRIGEVGVTRRLGTMFTGRHVTKITHTKPPGAQTKGPTCPLSACQFMFQGSP